MYINLFEAPESGLKVIFAVDIIKIFNFIDGEHTTRKSSYRGTCYRQLAFVMNDKLTPYTCYEAPDNSY